jgi:membrane-bound serine protease (ClpP class)
MLQSLLVIALGALMGMLRCHAAVEPASVDRSQASRAFKVAILPIRDDITASMVFLVRRGVKEALEQGADLLVVDMDTNGGRVDKTEEIIDIIGQFRGTTVTYVNRRAFSAGAFIAFATQRIYMAPEAVIGAAAPIMVAPGGGVQTLNDTYEAKMSSAVAAMVRASAEKNGHNVDVADAMVRRTKELVIDGEILNKQGEILTLTSKAASKTYGKPSKPLLSLGTFDTLDELLRSLGRGTAARLQIEASGWEKAGGFLSSQWVSSLLLIIGIAGIYIEFKTPGFGIPGIVGIIAFGLYFLGGFIAGLSGAGWILVFFLGVGLFALEFFVFPGTFVAGFTGIVLMFTAVVMSLVDLYPSPGRWMPAVPGKEAFVEPLQTLSLALFGGLGVLFLLSRLFPHTGIYRDITSGSASGMQTEAIQSTHRAELQGREGVALSPLRPGGRAQFGDQVCDALSQGEMIQKGERVRVIGFSGAQAIVERI